MKKSKTIKLILIILICVLVMLVGFLGIYVKKSNSYKNILPDYLLASDLKGSTVLEFEVNDSKDTIYYDKDGKKVDSSVVTSENEGDYTKEEKAKNNPEDLNESNYNKVVKIMKQRLEFLKADQYNLDLDKKTGKIVLTYDDDYKDDIKSILPMEGKLQLIDSSTSDVIIDYTDFESAQATYASVDEGYVTYINLKLNSNGVEKINNIDKYKTESSTEGNSETEETAVNKLKVMFDNDSIAEVTYDNIQLVGKELRITTASKLTSNSTIQSQMNTNTVVSKLATIGKMPVIYKVAAEEYVKTNILNYINYIILGIAIICAIISLYFIIKYKLNGLLNLISFATNISIFLIIIRLTKIPISLNSFAAILGLIVLNTILTYNILKQSKEKDKTFSENMKKAYLKTVDAFVITLIIFVVFSFTNMTVINSMGLLLFWGWTIVLFGNLIFTIPLLYINSKK